MIQHCDQPGCPGSDGELRLLPKGPGRWDTPKAVCWSCHGRVIVPTGEFRLRWTNLLPDPKFVVNQPTTP